MEGHQRAGQVHSPEPDERLIEHLAHRVDIFLVALEPGFQRLGVMQPNVLDIQLNYADILVANNQQNRAKSVLEEVLRKTADNNKKKLIKAKLDNL